MKTVNVILLSLIILFSACTPKAKKQITIFYTADEHGWFSENPKADGAAAMMQLWKEKENYDPSDDSFLVLSGGDNWTGASASTWFKGQSMFQVMNAMGYDASALGNHEFDFTRDTLAARVARSNFPYLAANIVDENGETPSCLKPYVLLEVNGLSVALLGLANLETPHTTSPAAVEGLSFKPYKETVEKYAPQIKASGADVVIIIGHLCKFEMLELIPLAVEFGIPLITGGHCHKEVLEEKDGVLMIESESYFRSYVKVVLEYDSQSELSKVLSYEVVKNVSDKKDEEIATLVKKWESVSENELSAPIGYLGKTITRKSLEMQELVLNSWLAYYESADLAITNMGSIRQDLEKGKITSGDVIGLLPFNNALVQMHLNGAEIKDFIERLSEMEEDYIWAGMSYEDKFEDDKIYEVITNDFLYALGETKFKNYDPKAYNTGVIYREPLIEFIKGKNTSEENPL